MQWNGSKHWIHSTHSLHRAWWWLQWCPCCWWHCRCILQSLGGPRWAAPACCSPPCVSRAEESAAWTRWLSGMGNLQRQIREQYLSYMLRYFFFPYFIFVAFTYMPQKHITYLIFQRNFSCFNQILWPSLPWASQRSTAFCPSTTIISGSGTEALGTVGTWEPPSTTTSTLVSVVPSLLRAVQTYVPLSSGRATSICKIWNNRYISA